MTLVQIYLHSLIKKKNLITIITLLFFFYNTFVYSKEINSLVRINKNVITNLDVKNEIQYIKYKFKNSNNIENLKNLAIKNLIDEIIKTEEVKKENIKLPVNEYNKNVNIIISNISQNSELTNEKKEIIKNKFLKQLELDLKWIELIKIKYLSEIKVNESELKDLKKKLSKEELNNFILFEKNKKLIKFSNLHLLNVKKNYIIKFL